jgi:hypothetical protein
MVVMVVMVSVDPTRDPDDDAVVVVVMVMTEAVMMVMMTDTDIQLRDLRIGFILRRSRRVRRPQRGERVGDRIEQFGKRPRSRQSAGVLRSRCGGLRGADCGQSRNCADDTHDCLFHGAFPLG